MLLLPPCYATPHADIVNDRVFYLWDLEFHNQLCPNIYPSFFPISLMRLWQLEVTWTYTLQFALGGCFVIKILQQPSFIYYILSNKKAFIELYQETMKETKSVTQKKNDNSCLKNTLHHYKLLFFYQNCKFEILWIFIINKT